MLRVGFPGASRGWKADPAEMERVEEFKVGDWVRIRPTLTTAKHGFGSATPGSIGVVYCIKPDSSLMVELSYLPHPWHCEPEEVEPVEPFRVRQTTSLMSDSSLLPSVSFYMKCHVMFKTAFHKF